MRRNHLNELDDDLEEYGFDAEKIKSIKRDKVKRNNSKMGIDNRSLKTRLNNLEFKQEK